MLYILKQLFASVSVNSGGYLPRQSGLVNIHRYSPPLSDDVFKWMQCATKCRNDSTQLSASPARYPIARVARVSLTCLSHNEGADAPIVYDNLHRSRTHRACMQACMQALHSRVWVNGATSVEWRDQVHQCELFQITRYSKGHQTYRTALLPYALHQKNP